MAVIDNSEAKKLKEELLQAHKMQAVGLLAGGISHEINNMLAVVIGYTELAQEAMTENTVVEEDLNEVLLAAGRIKTLVKQLLTFSRKSDRNVATINLSQAIQEALKVQRNTIPVSISIKQDIQSDRLNVFADQVEINQIILNLFSNSIHAMQENGTILLALKQVTLKKTDSDRPRDLVPGDYAILSFCDTGEGMKETTRQQIFDPFFTTRPVGKGTGMGLSIVHGIMQNYRGAITVDSIVNKGTTFKLYFPISQEVVADRSNNICESVPTGTECILYVDDEQQIVEIGRRILEGLGYSVVSLTSGMDALNCFFADPDKFDLVISDQIMPDISGLELIQKIHLHRKHLPVILCTGYSTQVDENKARLMDISFIMKPFVLHELAQLVRKVLDTKI
ncbi:response regulator [Desulforhopalus vacuolatus]|uniref:ATP-binding protein n=1 Tax=Desulforhopalus vacuolatus TaxID=40414 RepID=UPI001965784C|nr:ATP-binding protein [Desulforhopalus vacuolatus]MBM9520377.1 response regulator [Desulforhopalus vacuolatus]